MSIRNSLVRALVLVAVIALDVSRASNAQESSPPIPSDQISCSSNFGNDVELDKNAIYLVPASKDEISALLDAQPAMSAGPFAAGQFPFERVQLFVTGTPQPGAEEQPLSIFARTLTDRAESWFKLEVEKENWNVSDALRLHAYTYAEFPQEWLPRALSGIRDTGVPIFRITWTNHESGANTFADVQHILLLDFRKSPPSVMAMLQCVSAEGGGVCGVHDNGNAPTTSLTCDWQPEKSDFLCTSATSGDSAVPTFRRYYLGSGAPDPFLAAPGEPANLSEFADRILAGSPSSAKPASIPGLGPTTFVGRFTLPQRNRTTLLFAARGQKSSEPRLLAVEVDPPKQKQILEIQPQPILDVVSDSAPSPTQPGSASSQTLTLAHISPEEAFADDVFPLFRITPLVNTPQVAAWRILVKQGSAHEILWLAAGINPGTSAFVLDALRVASEFEEYASCGSYRSLPFAASVRRKPGTLQAAMDVEPAQLTNLEEKTTYEGDPACPVRVDVHWDPALGFFRKISATACVQTGMMRTLSISDDGVISAKSLKPKE